MEPSVVNGLSHLIYITSKVFDPLDKGRIIADDSTIEYGWTK